MSDKDKLKALYHEMLGLACTLESMHENSIVAAIRQVDDAGKLMEQAQANAYYTASGYIRARLKEYAS